MADFFTSLGMIAPYYNLAMVLVSIWLFIVLIRTPSVTAFMKPWYLMFICLMIFTIEEIITVLRHAGYIQFIPQYTNAFWELGIIAIFIYAVLLQKEYVKNELAILD